MLTAREDYFKRSAMRFRIFILFEIALLIGSDVILSSAVGATRWECQRVLSEEPYLTLLRHDSLTDEEVRELIKIIKYGTQGPTSGGSVFNETPREEALEKIVLGHQKLVAKIALNMRTSSLVSLEDLMQAGNIGIYKAIEKFDPSDEGEVIPFFFVARQWIRDEMREELTHATSGIRMSRHFSDIVKAVSEETSQDPSLDLVDAFSKVAARKKWNISKEQCHLLAVRYQPLMGGVLSLDEIVSSGVDARGRQTSQSDFIPAKENGSLENKIFASELLARLQKREAEILRLRFVENWTLKLVGTHFGISYERIRQIEDRALKAIRSLRAVKDLSQ